VIRKYDLSYPSIKVAVEFNGKIHVLVPGAWEADLERRDAVDDSAWRLLPVISSGIYATPEQTLRRVHRVLLARGLPGVPLRLSDDWRAHFPGHADAA
jgi:very-short-patch-repair endonuclease